MKALVTVIVGLFIAVLCISTTSCEKNTDCKASVKCVDSLGLPVSNAAVLLYATIKTSTGGTVTADVKANATTDAGGQVSFTFKLPAIYDVRATLVVSSPATRTLVGTGIIKLEEGKGVDKTVTLK